MSGVPILAYGVKFNEFGKWYSVVDGIIDIDDKKALVSAHEDDGFKKYYIFEKNNNSWHYTISSTSLTAIEKEYASIK